MWGIGRLGGAAAAAAGFPLPAGAALAAAAPQPPAALYAPRPAPRAPGVSLRPDQAGLLFLTLSQAETQGLGPGAFMAPALQSMLRSPDPETRRAGYAALV